MRPLTLIHEDDHVVACMKPPGLLTVKPPRGTRRKGEVTLIDRLLEQGLRLYPVHRLDQETSGVVLLARSPKDRDTLMELFKTRQVEKVYLAVVQGRLMPGAGSFEFPIRDLGVRSEIHPTGQPARTDYVSLESFDAATMVEVVPQTGRHNQIRLHFAHAGHPLVGERKYARGRDAVVRHKRAALHAASLTFVHPWDGQRVSLEASLPVDLENLLRKLRS